MIDKTQSRARSCLNSWRSLGILGDRFLCSLALRSECGTLRAPTEIHMSQHQSLKGASTIAAKRNVLKRFERVELLKKRGQFKMGDKVIGLPKTKPDA
jgi:small basic protein (TIGR04137 family)